MNRREFDTKTKVAIVKRATRDGVIYCEACGLPAKRFDVDHIICDAVVPDEDKKRKLTPEDGQLLCIPCHGVKTPKDTKAAAKVKRVEAKRLGVVKAKAKIKQRPKVEKPRKDPVPGMSNIHRRFAA